MKKFQLIGLFALVCLGCETAWVSNHETLIPRIFEASKPKCESNPRICMENFKRIQKGMTETEVEAILGPSGVYTSPDTYYYTIPMPSCGFRSKETVRDCQRFAKQFPIQGQKIWYGDFAFITVYFTPDGKVKEEGVFFDRAYSATGPDPLPTWEDRQRWPDPLPDN
jgi:hypothetical protein